MTILYVWASPEPRNMMGVGELLPGQLLPAGIPAATLAAWLTEGLIKPQPRPKRKTSKPSKPSKTSKPTQDGTTE
jgi:hypothetical protein